MLRFKLRYTILVSAVALVAGAIFAGVEAYQSPRPCTAVGSETPEIGSAPWHADLHVDPTDDPPPAAVRVALINSAAGSDFAVINDLAASAQSACAETSAPQFVAVSGAPGAAAL